MRLGEVIASDSARALPRMVWKEIAPQHHRFTPTGRWVENATAREKGAAAMMAAAATTSNASDTTGSDKAFAAAGGAQGCAVIADPRGAYQLNAIAHAIVGRGRGGGGSGAFRAVARTWAEDLQGWNLHVYGECTHYCNPSVVTWNWARRLFEAMASAVVAS